jgi:hypothetical protein
MLTSEDAKEVEDFLGKRKLFTEMCTRKEM